MCECGGCAWRWFRSSRLASRKWERVWLERSKVLTELACGRAAGTTHAWLEGLSMLATAHGEVGREALSASGRACR